MPRRSSIRPEKISEIKGKTQPKLARSLHLWRWIKLSTRPRIVLFMINTSLSILPQTIGTTLPGAGLTAPLFQRIQNIDPERSVGTQVRYNSFSDFITTFHAEANNPNVIGAADILDIINPLQHLPLIAHIYRDITNDQIKPGARLIGGAAFGGIIGLASSSINAVVEDKTGKDVPTAIMTALSGDDPFADQTRKSNINPDDKPQDQLNALLTDDHRKMIQHQKATTFYREVDRTISPITPARLVTMNDPERTAGTFYSYA